MLHLLTLCMLGNFSCFCCRLLTFFKTNVFKRFFQEHYQSVKQFGSRSGMTFCPVLIWVQTVCKGNQQTTLVGKELISLSQYIDITLQGKFADFF